ncbi:MAG: PASTA domain-containing protein [Actinomycetota bacterium]|nr:PASTA domain-containing protein [Actinomycetota bacterium]
MKRAISSVLALAMVAALLAIFAGAATAQVTEPSGQVAVINGASTDPVSVTIGADSLSDVAYAADAVSVIVPEGNYDVTFTSGAGDSSVNTAVGGPSAQTLVSTNGALAILGYPVDMTPIDAGMAKVTVWNTTDAVVSLTVDGGAPVDIAPKAEGPTLMVADGAGVAIDIDGVTKNVATPADSYTDVFAVNDGTTPAVALAIIPSITDLIAALTPSTTTTTTADTTTTTTPGGVTAPDVVGQTEDDATAAITDLGLVAAKTETADDKIAKGIVISQDPAGGTEVPDDSKVNIVVSTGSEEPVTVPVPDVSGMSAADAQTALEDAGFTVTSQEQESETVEAGLIIETNPSAETEVAAGTEVKMIVSTGFGDIVVPDFTGMTVDDATKAAEDAGLTIKFVEDADHPDPEGVIVSQDPTGGTTVEEGTEVVAQLSPAIDDAWVILTLSPNRVLTVSGINFQPGSTVDLLVVDTDTDAKETVQDDGSWSSTADLSEVHNEAELLLVTGTAADGSAYEATFKIPAAGESTDEPTDEVPAEEESSGIPVWVWIILGLLVIGIIALGIKMFAGGDSTGGDETPGTDTPTTETS